MKENDIIFDEKGNKYKVIKIIKKRKNKTDIEIIKTQLAKQ